MGAELAEQIDAKANEKYGVCVNKFEFFHFFQGTEGERTRDLLMSELNVLNNKLEHSLQVRDGWWR